MNRSVNSIQVPAIGLGCMNLSWAYGAPPTAEEGAQLLRRALDLGYRHLDTARLYANGGNEALVGSALKGRRDEFFLASKTGLFADADRRWVDCSAETIKSSCEASLKALGTDFIDLYYLHRRDFQVPIEESAEAMADLVRAGKIGGYGLSEMSAETLRRAHAVHPVTAVQVEYSLWTRNPEIAMLAAATELDVALVAFSPLGRGVWANGVADPSRFEQGDIRRAHPRFSAENWPRNYALVKEFTAIAKELGVTPAQLALAWVLSRGPNVHVIPGTSRLDHLSENIARLDWLPDISTLERLDNLINQQTVSGARYHAAMQTTMDSEDF